MGWRYDYKPYVPVAQRRAKAEREVAKRVKKGQAVNPVVIEGRSIVSTFWGKAWCTNLESYSDFENRLPRGRTYVRNGSVVHLTVEKGRITALVSGSELYTVRIDIAALPLKAWKAVKALCAGKIGSLVELLQGKLSSAVMEAVTDRAEGLFPKPKEITMSCSCPDYAGMCKHLAAVMYGIGNRLDSSPELLFELRGVDHQELIEQAIPAAPVRTKGSALTIESTELAAIFDIEIDDDPPTELPKSRSITMKAPKTSKPPKVKTAAATKELPKSRSITMKAPKASKPPKVKTAAAETNTTPTKKAAQKRTVTVKKAVQSKTVSVKKAAVATKKKGTPSAEFS